MIPKNRLNNDGAIKKLDKFKEIETNVDREKIVFETNEYKFSFQNFQTIKTFGKDIYDGTITVKEADDYQTNLLVKIMNFRRKKKKVVPKNLYNFFEGREVEKKFLMLLKVKYFK